MPKPKESELLTMEGWPLGVNNRVRETEQGPRQESRSKSAHPSLQLREAVNVDLTKLGHPIRRKGRELLAAGYTHSLWSDPSIPYALAVHEGWLCKLYTSGTLEQLEEVHPYARVSYCTVNGEVYWSNGISKGRVADQGALHWGLPRPNPPQARLADGSLTKGAYRVATTYVDEFGEEYGASQESVLDVVSGMIVTIGADADTRAEAVALYVSQPDGEILYKVGEYWSGQEVTILPGMIGKGLELETSDLQQVPVGKLVAYSNGRVYIARNKDVVFSEPLRYGLYRPSQGIYMFSSEIDLLAPVSDGIYVGNREGVYFLGGTDPYEITQRKVLSHAPVPNAHTSVPGEFLQVGDSDVPVWWGQDGAMVAGLPGGEIIQLSKDRLAVPSFAAGAMLYREQEGMAHVVSSLTRGGDSSAMGATDTVVAEVRRAGKKLNG